MVSLLRTIRHRQQTPEAASPLSPLCRVPEHQVVDTLTQNCSQLLPDKVVTDPGYSSTTQDRRITGTRFYQKITKTLMLSLHWLVVQVIGSLELWKGLCDSKLGMEAKKLLIFKVTPLWKRHEITAGPMILTSNQMVNKRCKYLGLFPLPLCKPTRDCYRCH